MMVSLETTLVWRNLNKCTRAAGLWTIVQLVLWKYLLCYQRLLIVLRSVLFNKKYKQVVALVQGADHF